MVVRTQAARRLVKGRRQNVVEVTLEGEGKLGLVFAKDSEPPQIKEIKAGGLAAKVGTTCCTALHFIMANADDTDLYRRRRLRN